MRAAHWFVLASAIAGCIDTPDDEVETGQAHAQISTTSVIPPDGECVHVVATRLSDFAVREYRGLLADASFVVAPGENHVTATAYPAPCSNEPAEPPWVADDQIVTFGSGANTLVLQFHRSGEVGIDPLFDDDAQPLVQPGSEQRTGGAYEDVAGFAYAIDGWDLRAIAVPPVAPSNVSLCRLTGLPYPPRGLATAGGRFVVQLSEANRPLYAYTGCTLAETWPVQYAPGQIVWTNTDGLEAIDDTHFVRTGYCATGCFGAGIELLELVTGTSGRYLVVTRQIPLPAPHQVDYPLSVTPVGPNFAVSIAAPTHPLLLIDTFGTLLASGTLLDDAEGLLDAGGGRIGAMSYRGDLQLYDATTLSYLGLSADYRQGADFLAPNLVTWLPAPRSKLLMLSSWEQQWMTVPADFSTPDYFASSYANPSGLDYRPDLDRLLVTNRVPPVDPFTFAQIPTVDVLLPDDRALSFSIQLQGLPLPVRSLSLAYITQGALIATHYTRPGAVPDASLDPVVYIHDWNGVLVRSFSLAPYGFRDIWSVDYLPASNELLVGAVDFTGTRRLVVTTPTGQPLRSYRVDELANPLDFAAITDGPFAGDVAVIQDGGSYVRMHLP